MSIDLLDLTLKIVPTAIAVIALTYTITQSRISKKQTTEKATQKKYLEDALTTLNKQIQSLNQLEPTKLNLSNPLLTDFAYEGQTVVWGLLEASFNNKVRKMVIEAKYYILYSEEGKNESQKISNFEGYDATFLHSMFSSEKFGIILAQSEVTIQGVHDNLIMNDISLPIAGTLTHMNRARKELAKFEELYENFSPNCIRSFDAVLHELIQNAYEIISVKKVVPIDLDDFLKTDDLTIYLLERITDYSVTEERLSKLQLTINLLNEARKQLSLKIVNF